MQDKEDAPTADGTMVRDAEAQGDGLLRAEIGFWRQLLAAAEPTLPPESIERMQQALALAEYRLLRQLGERPGAGVSSTGPESTSGVVGRCIH